MNPLLLLGLAAGALLLLSRSSSKNDSGGGVKISTKDGSPKAPRTRVVGPDDALAPSVFSTKYAGNANAWKDLPSVNPWMVIVYKQVDPSTGGIVWLPTTPVPPGVIMDSGLSPWAAGQEVTIPDSWPG